MRESTLTSTQKISENTDSDVTQNKTVFLTLNPMREEEGPPVPSQILRNLVRPRVLNKIDIQWISKNFPLTKQGDQIMSKHVLGFMTTVAALALSLNAFAQPSSGMGPPPPPGGFGPSGRMMMGGGIGMVLQNPEFAKMLELTPEQATRLQDIMRETSEERRRQMQEMQQGGAPPNPEQMRQRMEQSVEATQTKFDQVLNPLQRTKSREILFQLSGGLNSPMLNDRMLQVLELTDAQKEQVRKIISDRNEENRAAFQGGFNFRDASQEERDKFRADMETRNKKFADQITAILTPGQKEKAEKLTAEAPALREKLGLPEPGQGNTQRQRPQGGGGQSPAGGGYIPGANSWQPGQPPPTREQGGEQPRNFPRPREPRVIESGVQ